MKNVNNNSNEEHRLLLLVEKFLDSIGKINESIGRLSVSVESLINKSDNSANNEAIKRIISELNSIKILISELDKKYRNEFQNLTNLIDSNFKKLRYEFLEDRKFLLEEKKIKSNIEIAKINSDLNLKMVRSKFFYGIIGAIISFIMTFLLIALAKHFSFDILEFLRIFSKITI